MKMIKKILKVQLKVKTGLHIGSGNDKMQIGGVDSEVIKDPITKVPYIPGSSFKGKIRFLLETESEMFNSDDLIAKKNHGELNDKINLYFGPKDIYKKQRQNDKKEQTINEIESPTRIIFRDLTLCRNYEYEENGVKINVDYFDKFTSGSYSTELKTEISIDRETGIVTKAGPRTIERIPPEVVFEGEILIRYINDEELKEIEKVLNEGISLLNNDYLGGSGSRGYGAVEVKLINNQ